MFARRNNPEPFCEVECADVLSRGFHKKNYVVMGFILFVFLQRRHLNVLLQLNAALSDMLVLGSTGREHYAQM